MILKNFFRLFKTGIFQTIATILLLSFFIFFQNILLGLTYSVYTFSDNIKNKLGVYIYFKDFNKKDQVSKTYSLIIDMKDRLEKEKLKTKFLSKKEGIEALSKKFPHINEALLEKHGIKNPVPPILYIMFKTQSEYFKMKKIIDDKKYEDIIMKSLSDVGTIDSYTELETRVKKYISFSNFLIKFYIFLSVALFVSILWFLIMIIKINFYSFYNQIEVEKLIGFTYFQIKLPFLLYVIFVILLSFVFSLVYTYLLFSYLQTLFLSLFDFNFYSLIINKLYYIKLGLGLELGFTILVSLIISYIFLTVLIRKI